MRSICGVICNIWNSPLLLFVVRVATCLSSLWRICKTYSWRIFTHVKIFQHFHLSMCCLWDSKISKTCWRVWSFIPPSLLKQQLLGLDFFLSANTVFETQYSWEGEPSRLGNQRVASVHCSSTPVDRLALLAILVDCSPLQILAIGKCYCSDWPTTAYWEGCTKKTRKASKMRKPGTRCKVTLWKPKSESCMCFMKQRTIIPSQNLILNTNLLHRYIGCLRRNYVCSLQRISLQKVMFFVGLFPLALQYQLFPPPGIARRQCSWP